MAIWGSRRHHAPYAIAVATGPAYCPDQPAGSAVQSKPASAVSLALYYARKFADAPSCIIVAKMSSSPPPLCPFVCGLVLALGLGWKRSCFVLKTISR